MASSHAASFVAAPYANSISFRARQRTLVHPGQWVEETIHMVGGGEGRAEPFWGCGRLWQWLVFVSKHYWRCIVNTCVHWTQHCVCIMFSPVKSVCVHREAQRKQKGLSFSGVPSAPRNTMQSHVQPRTSVCVCMLVYQSSVCFYLQLSSVDLFPLL